MLEEEVTAGTSMTENERLIRERFVTEYLVDYDAFGAALRIGYQEAYARTFSVQFMQEPYVRQLISEREKELGLEDDKEKHKRVIVASLYRIAHSGRSSAAAQVAALGKLTSIFGLDAPVKTVSEVKLTDDGPNLDHIPLDKLEAIKQAIYGKPETVTAAK